ncbi:MAG: hypothetical protein K2I93_03910 [Oscillospiraceae bacterium]|nr:hypothetical protein [Oscillospiraceae bacterium]
MSQVEADALYLYLIRRLDKLEGELIECQNHLRLARRPDEQDFLAYIRALNRFQMFVETSRDVAEILKLVYIDRDEVEG